MQICLLKEHGFSKAEILIHTLSIILIIKQISTRLNIKLWGIYLYQVFKVILTLNFLVKVKRGEKA